MCIRDSPYTLEMAYTLDELQRAREAGTLESLLLSVESVFTCLPAVEVNLSLIHISRCGRNMCLRPLKTRGPILRKAMWARAKAWCATA